MDTYTRLQKLLNIHPSGAPASESFDKILRLLFTPEEAEIACYLNYTLQSLDEIQKKIGRRTEKLKSQLDAMADRGCIMGVKIKHHDYYSLLPTLPGFYEFPFMRPGSNPHSKELAVLWQQYLREGFSDSLAGSPTPQMRVIPVQKSIPATTEILYYEQASEMISRAKLIAVTNCACKEIMNACSKPREVCLAFDNSARYLLDKGWARKINKEETLKILKAAEAEGMVHCVRNSRDKLSIMCNCCSCCCMLLRGITAFNNPSSIAASAYIVRFYENKCIGCMACTDKRCPVHAIKPKQNLIEVETEKCIGCGLCVSVCSVKALKMENRIPEPCTPDTDKELTMILLKEKGKIDIFNDLNNK